VVACRVVRKNKTSTRRVRGNARILGIFVAKQQCLRIEAVVGGGFA
jgi:hypothetical protein